LLFSPFVFHAPPISHVQGSLIFYGKGLLALRPTPKAGGPPLVVCPRLLIQYIRSYPP
jgi:hypothetical protein